MTRGLRFGMTKYSHIVSDKCGDCLHYGRFSGECVGACANPFAGEYGHYLVPTHPANYSCYDNAGKACNEGNER